MEQAKIRVEATIHAETNKVWDYWTKPEHITKWNFANDEWHCPKAESDLIVGGKYFARMEAKDGSFGFDFEATYDEVIDQKEITYTMSDGRQSTTTFENLNSTTKIITVFDAESSNSIEMQQQGWLAILNNFKKFAETN
jgi:uncharacterized protein YndB with AHSA1/START domain